MTLSERDRTALRQAFLGDGRSTVAYALAEGRTERASAAVEQIVARHVAAALTEAADAIEGKACDGSPESCADVLAGAPCPYESAARIVRNLAAP